jgi:hypothetical protein
MLRYQGNSSRQGLSGHLLPGLGYVKVCPIDDYIYDTRWIESILTLILLVHITFSDYTLAENTKYITPVFSKNKMQL